MIRRQSLRHQITSVPVCRAFALNNSHLPKAYRGVSNAEVKGGIAPGAKSYSKPLPKATSPQERSQRHKMYVHAEKRRVIMLQIENELVDLHAMIVQGAASYRSNFWKVPETDPYLLAMKPVPADPGIPMAEDEPTTSDADEDDDGKPKPKHKRKSAEQRKQEILKTISNDLQSIFRDIHQRGSPVDWETIQRTETSFGELGLALQDITRRSLSLSTLPENAEIPEYTDHAVLCVNLLSKLVSERKLLVESSQGWKQRQAGSDGSFFGSVKNAFKKVYSFFGGSEAKPDAARNSEQAKPMSHEDEKLQVSRSLFNLVVNSSSLAFQPKEQGESAFATKAEEKTRLKAASRQFISLLNSMPASFVPDAEIIQQILHIQGQIGSLESARDCHATFQRFPGTKSLRFAMVLRAYLEAVKVETVESNMAQAAEEIVSVLNNYWDDNMPKHRFERIVHSSIVLEALAIADQRRSGSDSGSIRRAEDVLERTISTDEFVELQQQILSGSGNADLQTLPLVNSLARIYAFSGENHRIETAKKMLVHVILHKSDRGINNQKFSVIETFNDILSGMLRRWANKDALHGGSDNQTTTIAKDLKYAYSVLDTLLLKNDMDYLPTNVTFDSFFRLLLLAKPGNLGECAEELLGHMEVVRAWTRASPQKVAITLSTYHSVLSCLISEAKMGSPEACNGAAERAFLHLRRLEIQSIPLAMSHAEMKLPTASGIYNSGLRPTATTYRMVLLTCVAANGKEETEAAGKIACDVCERMIKNGIVFNKKIIDVLEAIVSKLDESSEHKKVLESVLQQLPSLLEESTEQAAA
jgi:hypothetical protein